MITGGAGYLGSHLANTIKDDVIIVDNLSTGRLEDLDDSIEFVVQDVTDKELLEELFRKHTPERVIHLVSHTRTESSEDNPQADLNTNVISTINVLEMCAKYRCAKFILGSTTEVYGVNDEQILIESSPLIPASPYAASKISAEYYTRYMCNRYNIPFSILRYSEIFGPYQEEPRANEGSIAYYIRKLRQSVPTVNISGDGEQVRDYIYIDDAVEATILATQTYNNGTLNIAGKGEKSINDIINFLASEFNVIPAVKHTDFPRLHIPRLVAHNIKAVNELGGWKPKYSVEDGIKKMLREEDSNLQPSA